MHPESVESASRAQLREIVVQLVRSSEQHRYQELMREHRYLGDWSARTVLRRSGVKTPGCSKIPEESECELILQLQ
jgi:hypothetical protein